MKNFIFKSSDPDLQKMFQLIETIDKNVLYTTYRIDIVTKWIRAQEADKGLQKQVDDYFEENDETSPQTNSENNGPDSTN